MPPKKSKATRVVAVPKAVTMPDRVGKVFVEHVPVDKKTLKRYSFVNSTWRAAARPRLFTKLVFQARRCQETREWEWRHGPLGLRSQFSFTTLSVVKEIVFTSPILQVDNLNRWHMNGNVVLATIISLANCKKMVINAPEFGYGADSQQPLFTDVARLPQFRRPLERLEIYNLLRFSYDSYIFGIFATFSELDTLFIQNTSAKFGERVSTMNNDLPFPKIRNLIIDELVTKHFVDGLLCGKKDNRLASLQSIDIRLFLEPEMADLKLLGREAGGSLRNLKLCLYDPISSVLHARPPANIRQADLISKHLFSLLFFSLLTANLTAERFGGEFWNPMIDWDLFTNLEDLTVYSELCTGTTVEQYLPLATMPSMTGLLKNLAKSKEVCKSAQNPLRLTLELRVVDPYHTNYLVEYCKNTLWKQLKTILVDLRRNAAIRLQHVTIKLCGKIDLANADRVKQATLVLNKGIRDLGLDFVEGPIVVATPVIFPMY